MKYLNKVISLAIIAFSVFLSACPSSVSGLQYIDLINTSIIPGNKQDSIPLGNEQSNESCFFTLIVCDKSHTMLQ